MSTSRTIDNLNIRKFSNKAAFDSATIGEDDICVLLDDGTPLMYTTALPEPSASVANAVYYLISDYQGQTGWYQGQRIYKCLFNGSNYYWNLLNTQENPNYGSRYSDVLTVTSVRTAFRFAQASLPLGGFIVQMSDGLGSDFLAVIVGDAGTYRQTTIKATGAFEGIRFGTYKTSTSATLSYYILAKKDNSPFFNSSTRVTYTVTGIGNDTNVYQYGRMTTVAINSGMLQTRTWFEMISGSQTPDMPEITPDILGQTRQYTGVTDSTYTNGYFYKATGTEVVIPAVMATTIISPSGEATVSIDATSFIRNFCNWVGWSVAELERNLTNSAQQTWIINYSIDNAQVVEVYVPFYGWVGATNVTQCFAVTYTGSSSSGNVDINFTVAYTPAEHTVQDGAWQQIDVQPSSGGATYTAGNGISIDANNEISVTAPTLQNGGTGTDALAINTTGRFNTTVAIGKGAGSGGGVYWLQDVLIGNNADCTCAGAVAIGYGAKAGNGSDVGEGSIAIGSGATVTRNMGVSPRASGIAIGKSAQATETATQIGSGTNNDVDTVKIANRNGNFEIISADGTIPADRLTRAINKYSTMPTAGASNAGWIVQYTGTTDATYTHGYIYENTESLGLIGPAADATEGEPGESMVFALDADAFAAYLQTKSIVLSGQTTFYLEENSDPDTGDNIYALQDADSVAIEEFSSLSDMESATGITWGGQEDLTGDFPYSSENATGFVVGPTYAWNQIDVQPAPAVPDPLPSQTGNAGRFLTTDGTDASWSDSVNIPFNRVLSSVNETLYSVKYNNDEKVTASYLGSDGVLSFSIKGVGNNYVGLQYRATDNQRYIRPSNNNLTTLGDSNRKWANVYTNKLNNGADIAVPNATGTMAVISVNTIVTLAVADWSSNTQTVNVTGMTATGVVFVNPDPSDQADYTSAGILCTAQAAGTLTFTCDTVPSGDIDVVVVML